MPPNYPNQGQNQGQNPVQGQSPNQGQNQAQYPNQYPNSNQSQVPVSHELTPNEFAKHSMPKFGKIFAIILFTTASVILLSFGIVYLMKYLNEKTAKTSETTTVSTKLASINLQPAIDQWLSAQVNKKNNSILVYDLKNQEIIGRNNDFTQNNSQGVENLFLVYLANLLFKQDTWKKEDLVKVGEESLTKETCLTRIIQENHVSCKEAIVSELGADQLKQFLKDQSYENTNLTAHLSNTSDLLSLAKRFYNHPDFSNDVWEDLKLKLDPKANVIASTNPLLSGFQKLKPYGIFGAASETSSNYSYINNLYFIETVEEDPARRRTIVLIYLATDTDAASVIDLAKVIEKSLI
ncbi:hypothetical protein EUA80_00485 [TM7 phylum sp. oral taxon 351]|jgi:hypothetical protein|nr:hypothetical protein EUA80_00485 [TM7 phylum sp. oral taxon 351]